MYLRRTKRKNSDVSVVSYYQLAENEWDKNPKLPKAKLIDLGTCGFVERHENVLLIDDDLGLPPLRGDEPGDLAKALDLEPESLIDNPVPFLRL